MNPGCARLAAVLIFALVFALLAAGDAAGQYQPRLHFRVLATVHFRIYFHQDEEPLARRLASIAESVRATLPARVGLAAPPLTHVVLANQDDTANGWATPVPYCTIRIAAAWPRLSELVGNTDDWLKVVFVHEYVHILQLDQSFGWAMIAKSILGRSPAAFPNLFLPQWQIEGLATFWETRATGLGRLAGGDAADIVRGRARLPRGEPLDRVNGGAVEWPGGHGQYLEGAWFYDYLAERAGEDAGGRLARITAGRLPYLSSAAIGRVFGTHLGDLWTDFQREVAAQADAPPRLPEAGRRLTSLGFFVTSPRFAAGGRSVVYSVSGPDGLPAVLATDLASGVTRQIADRVSGTRIGTAGDLLVFDQLDLSDNTAWRSDLFVAEMRSGQTARLTRDARLVEPDLSPDGGRLACLHVADDGRRELAFYTVARGGGAGVALSPLSVRIPPDPDASYGAPRWSPDGRRLAVERRRLGGPSEIVVFDLADGTGRVVAASDRYRNIEPSWSTDGRGLLFASDRMNRSFQVYALSLQSGELRRVTEVAGGAQYPELSPDGRTLVYVGSGAGGYDLFEVPVDPDGWRVEDAGAIDGSGSPRWPDGLPPATAVGSTARSVAYSPLPTLLPRAWTPLADSSEGRVRVGVAVNGADVLLRHAFAATVLWRLGSTDAAGGPRRSRPDWSAGYVYSRWRPAVFAAASDKTSWLRLVTSDGRALPDVGLREQGLSAGVWLPFQRARRVHVWQAAINLEREALDVPGTPTSRNRNAFRAAWVFNSAKTYARSVSREDGVTAAITSEQVRKAFGADGNADAFTGELRAFLRPAENHAVLAVRAAFSAATGDPTVRRQFYVGGASSAGGLANFGSGALRMLRGFGDEALSGRRAAVASVEWRQPVWRVDRGWGTFPLFLRAVHGAVFADAGQAWDLQFAWSRVRTSVGAEASADIVAGYSLPLTLTAGVVWARDGAAGRRAPGVYFRLGPSF